MNENPLLSVLSARDSKDFEVALEHSDRCIDLMFMHLQDKKAHHEDSFGATFLSTMRFLTVALTKERGWDFASAWIDSCAHRFSWATICRGEAELYLAKRLGSLVPICDRHLDPTQRDPVPGATALGMCFLVGGSFEEAFQEGATCTGVEEIVVCGCSFWTRKCCGVHCMTLVLFVQVYYRLIDAHVTCGQFHQGLTFTLMALKDYGDQDFEDSRFDGESCF